MKDMLKVFLIVLIFLFLSFNCCLKTDSTCIVSHYNNPPNPPEIEGPTNCKIRKEYTYNITITEPDGHRMTELYVEFGDDSNITLYYKGTSSCKKGWRSGMTLQVFHVWKKPGNYTVKAQVMDYFFEWSDWGYLNLEVSKEKHNMVFYMKNNNLPNHLFNYILRSFFSDIFHL